MFFVGYCQHSRYKDTAMQQPPEQSADHVYADGQLTVDFALHQVTVRGRSVHLTPTELAVLQCLIDNRHRIVPTLELLDDLRGPGYEDRNLVRWQIRQLRLKVEEDSARPQLIINLPRVGYRYVPPQ